ncbi:MAG: CHAT domain-containing protein [Chloracidobacterium sp.]|nr:CHAT domain-containing protein [Chloracidobacterium sp.]
MNHRRNRNSFREVAVLLTALLLFRFSAVTPSGAARGRARSLIQQSKQEPSGAGNERDVRALEVGKPIRNELAGGQTHVYRVLMNADQFLKVIVEQQGIDVAVDVSGPDGKQILVFDSESRPKGSEVVSLVTEAAGSFLLTIRPMLNRAPAGNYEIQIEELRAATGADHALHDARKRFQEATKLRDASKLDEALTLAERALEIREKIQGAEHDDLAAAINLLAGIYTDRGEYVKAEPLYKRALDIREKTLGKDHPGIAESLNDMANLYLDQGKYGEAEPLFTRALGIEERALGKDHPLTAYVLSNLALLYTDQGKYSEAEPLFKRSLDIRVKALGKDHQETSISLNNLAYLYYLQWKYKDAELLYKRALDIREKTLGKDHPFTANTLTNLATLYTDQGKYSEAEPLLKRELEISEKQGKDHLSVAFSLNNLAFLYCKRGRYEEAEPLLKRALEIRQKAQGNNHPETANSLNSLAYIYQKQGKYSDAEPLYKLAIDIEEKMLGKDHRDTANSLNNLANLYREQLKYGEAEPLYKRALDIREKAFGKDHPSVGASLNSLALLYASQGKYEGAELLYNRALGIFEKALGENHPDTIASLDNLAILYAAKGDLVQAVNFQSRANAAGERSIARSLVIGSERHKLAFLATLSEQTDRTISLHVHSAPSDPLARDLAATLLLQRKGRALDATSQNLNALRSRFNSEDQALLDRLTETRAQIATLTLHGPQRMTPEEHQARIKALEGQADKDEDDISRRSDEFRAQRMPVTLEAVRQAIPPDAALIEFAAYHPFNAKAINGAPAYGQARYVAYVLGHDGEIQWKELGDVKAIDSAIAALRKALRDPKCVDVKRVARSVDAKVFQSIRPLLGGKSRLLISPDGSLNLISFAALVDERGRYAIERYSISYLTSGRDLLRLQVRRESKDGPLVVAAPDFGSRGQVEVAQSEKQDKGALAGDVKEGSARSAINGFYFPPLPQAAQEGEALRELLPGATLLTKEQATKAALVHVHGPSLLHIATHGFFLEDQPLTSIGERGAQSLSDGLDGALQELEQQGVRIESPLLRSGLALAGANEHKEDDNGILTALELTGLNLWGTKLVTLSACDTGVGEVKNGDGVYGLRRALALAGAEAQVMSLWAVSDKATRELMVSYYRRLQDGQGRGEALRQSQLEMLKNKNRRHPYYWASFIESGEWANLDGK